MSWQFDQIRYVLGLSGIMSFYGIVGLIVLVMPEDTMGWNYKIVVIGLVLITLPFSLIIMFVASRRAKKKARLEAEEAERAAASESAGDQPVAATAGPVGTFETLTTGAEEAVQFLKTSSLGEGGRDAVYSLPWYIVAGAPKSGKSSLVLSSNLSFQTLPSQRQSEQKFIRPTGNIDWRVTSDAVFLDTAGRYQIEGVDGEEWSSLLETIKKYRSNRPLDGFLLVVNAETILKSDDRQVEELAKVLRARLDDAMQRLKVRFPVYLIFTHSDTIEGFRDSFSSSKNEDKTLVWGATIPIEKSENAQTLFDGEFEILQNGVMKRRVVRLSAPFPPVRQLRIFNFPLHFGSARRKFGSFVSALFRPNPFSENPFLRGFYFTAAPPAKSAGSAPATVSRGFFTERLFRDVILRDKDLVKTFLAERARPPILGWFLTFLGALITISLLVMAGVSLFSNRQLLADSERRGKRLIEMRIADEGRDILSKSEDEVRNEIATVDDLRGLLVRLDEYDRNGAPFYMRFGLYSGNRVFKEKLLPNYFTVIERRFKAPTVKKIEEELEKFVKDQSVGVPGQMSEKDIEILGRHYDLLKAYLMLTSQYSERAESTHLVATLEEFWATESKVPTALKLDARQQLEFWAKQVDRQENNGNFPRIAMNSRLVEDTRKKLQAFPPVQRYYRRSVTEISKQVKDSVGEMTVAGILTRAGSDASYMTGTYEVPGAFTRPGNELMKKAISEAQKEISAEDWVVGETGKKELAYVEADAAVMEGLYYRDYADQWRNFVKGVDVKRYGNSKDAESALQALSLANSPMKVLMMEINRHTNLSAKIDEEGWIAWIIGSIRNMFSGKTETDTGGSQPEKEFRALFSFIGKKEDGENAPIERYRGELGRLHAAIAGKTDDQMKKIAAQLAQEEPVDSINIGARERAISGLLAGFTESPAAIELASLLERPVTNLKSLLGADVKSQLAKAWSDQILPEARTIEKGFPFEEGQSDSDLTKLTQFLNPGDGTFSKFYDNRLSMYFEESGGELKLKDTAEIKFGDEFVKYLNNAVNLRKALFGSSPTPKFEYAFELLPMKEALIEVTIDGQKATSEATGSLRGSFPGTGADTGVLLNFASTSSVATSDPAQSTPGAAAEPLRFSGIWGLFRFVDAGSPQKQPGGEYILTYSLGGRSIKAEIKPSGGDLFNKTIFRQMKAPDALLK
jgi:type VI secretion system protein ImpL